MRPLGITAREYHRAVFERVIRYLLLIVPLGSLFARAGHAQCSDVYTKTGMALVSDAREGVPVVLRVSEFYPSAATIGTAKATVTGRHIDVTQANNVEYVLPAFACRTQFLNLGLLAAGEYDVTWTTVETTTIPPMTRTRVLTFAFAIGPAVAVPATSEGCSLDLW